MMQECEDFSPDVIKHDVIETVLYLDPFDNLGVVQVEGGTGWRIKPREYYGKPLPKEGPLCVGVALHDAAAHTPLRIEIMPYAVPEAC